MLEHEPPGAGRENPQRADEISFLDLAIVLAKYKWLILGLPLVAAVLAVAYTRQLPDIYTASVTLLPPQGQSTAGNIGGMAGALASLGVSGSGLPYLGMLKSRRVADAIIERLDLNTRFEQKLQSDTRGVLSGMTTIRSEKDGSIFIDVDNKDPQLAAVLANAYADELYKLTNVLAVTDASRRRLFYERQLALAKGNLLKAEMSVKQSLEKGGLVEVAGQGQAILATMARLRGEISAKEVQIGVMRTFAAERNPELFRAQQELEVMKQKLVKMEAGEGAKNSQSAGSGRDRGIDNLRVYRDLKYYETIYESLTSQYKLAQVEEAKDSSVIQVLDKAIEPDRPSKPNRRNIVLLWTLGTLIAVILLAFVRELMARASSDPEQTDRMQVLKRHLRVIPAGK